MFCPTPGKQETDEESKGYGRQPASGNEQPGFASMNEDRQREIASEGGKAAHESCHAHEFNSQEAEAGRKGGETVSKDRRHMAEIGREGGHNSHGGSNSANDDDSKSSGTHERGGTHEQHVEAGHKGGESRGGSNSDSDENSGGGQRGGSHEQHVKAGQQSHKNS